MAKPSPVGITGSLDGQRPRSLGSLRRFDECGPFDKVALEQGEAHPCRVDVNRVTLFGKGSYRHKGIQGQDVENPPFTGFPDADDGLGDPITMADQAMDLSPDQFLRSGKTLRRRRTGRASSPSGESLLDAVNINKAHADKA